MSDLRALLQAECDFWSAVQDQAYDEAKRWRHARRFGDRSRRRIYQERMAVAGLALMSFAALRAKLKEGGE